MIPCLLPITTEIAYYQYSEQLLEPIFLTKYYHRKRHVPHLQLLEVQFGEE